jgi:hypothetical protein
MESFFHAGMVACKHELTYGLVGVERGTFDRFGVVDRDTYLQRLLWNFLTFGGFNGVTTACSVLGGWAARGCCTGAASVSSDRTSALAMTPHLLRLRRAFMQACFYVLP